MNIGDDNDTQNAVVEDLENTSAQGDEGQSAAGTTDAPEGDEGGEKTFSQKELDEIVAKRIARERKQIAREREMASREEELLAKPINSVKRADFDNDEEYAEAFAQARLKQVAEAKGAVKAESDGVQWLEKNVDKHGEDFEYYALNPRLAISETMSKEIMDADNGGDILFHLGKNPKEALRIFKLSPRQQIEELAKIEASLGSGGGEGTERKTSSAPAPIVPGNSRPSGGAKPFDPMDATMAKTMDPADWIRNERKRVEAKLRG